MSRWALRRVWNLLQQDHTLACIHMNNSDSLLPHAVALRRVIMHCSVSSHLLRPPEYRSISWTSWQPEVKEWMISARASSQHLLARNLDAGTTHRRVWRALDTPPTRSLRLSGFVDVEGQTRACARGVYWCSMSSVSAMLTCSTAHFGYTAYAFRAFAPAFMRQVFLEVKAQGDIAFSVDSITKERCKRKRTKFKLRCRSCNTVTSSSASCQKLRFATSYAF